MRRYSEYTIDELLELENEWWDREDETNLSWINEGIKISSALKSKKRKEITYKETLGYLLILKGEFLKIKDLSFEKAINVFQELIRYEPENARAHYRLGFLYFYEEDWIKSLDAFYQAIHSSPRQSRKQLTTEQKVKAHYYIVRNSQSITNKALKHFNEIPSEELEISEEINFLLKEMRGALKGQEETKPYEMVINGIEYRGITEEEYEIFSEIDHRYVIFNYMSMNHTTVSLGGKEVSIPLKQVAVLEYLMKNPGGITRGDLVSRLSQQSRNPEAALRQIISRLRTRLAELDPHITFIETIEGGYKWSWSGEYRMFKHSRYVGTDLMLD